MRGKILGTGLWILITISTVPDAASAISVESVVPDGPAAEAGLQAGDRILRMDGRQVATMDDLQAVTAAHEPGDEVPITVEREGEAVDLSLTFGERPGGGVSIGVRLTVSVDPGSGPTPGTVECLAWIDRTYRIDAMMQDLDLDMSESYGKIRACVEHDTQRMTSANAVKYCDNVFKVHCSAIDLLTEIAESQVQRCETLIHDSLGLNLKQYQGWKTCGQNKVFDRYSMAGEASDGESCKAAFLEACGTNLDATIKTDGGSPDQRGFLECCSADTFDPATHGDRCGMIDDGFSRGPCHDRSICVNRLTSEWIHCSALER